MGFNVAAVHEALSAAIPDRECIVFRERRLTYADVCDRTRRLARVLRDAGLGETGDLAAIPAWESAQDHVALHLLNGNEYLEGMLGAWKARCVPVNVNWRYGTEELTRLFADAGPRAVIFHSRFASRVAEIRAALPQVRLWLQVADGSGAELLPGALDYESALRASAPEEPIGLSPDDRYILYTGGTTGPPKGVLWRQDDLFRAALCIGGPHDLDALLDRARKRPGPRSLPVPPFMHGAAHWVAFNVFHAGGTVLVQSHPERLDAADVWSTAERERADALTIVGDAFAVPLLDELARRPYSLPALRLLNTGGAALGVERKRSFLAHLPALVIVDALGASESGSQASHVSTAASGAATGTFRLGPEAVVLREDRSGPLAPGSDEVGWLARREPVPMGYLHDPERTARTFPRIEGVRHSVPGDRCRLAADGSIELLGRDSGVINSGGEKIFAEEVENAIKLHPDVVDALVIGTPSARFGQSVTAIVSLRSGATAGAETLGEVVRAHLASYKAPRTWCFVDEVARSASGKADYAWARRVAAAERGANRD